MPGAEKWTRPGGCFHLWQGGGALPQSIASDLLTHKPTGDKVTVFWAQLSLFPHLRVLCSECSPCAPGRDKSRTFGGSEPDRGTCGLALSSKPGIGLSQGQLPGSKHNKEPPGHPHLPGHHRSLPMNVSKLGRAFPPLQSQGPAQHAERPLSLSTQLLLATVDGRLPFICKYSGTH